MLKTAKIKKSGQFSDFTTVRRIGHLFSAKWQLNTTFNNAWKMDIFWKIGCLKPVIADSDPERTSQALKMHSPPSCPLHLQFGAHHLDLKSCCQDCWLPMEKGSKSGPGKLPKSRVFWEWPGTKKRSWTAKSESSGVEDLSSTTNSSRISYERWTFEIIFWHARFF